MKLRSGIGAGGRGGGLFSNHSDGGSSRCDRRSAALVTRRQPVTTKLSPLDVAGAADALAALGCGAAGGSAGAGGGLNRGNLALLLRRRARRGSFWLRGARCGGFCRACIRIGGPIGFRVGGLARDDRDGRFGLDHGYARRGSRRRIGSLGEAAEQDDADGADDDGRHKLKDQPGRKPAELWIFLKQSRSPSTPRSCGIAASVGGASGAQCWTFAGGFRTFACPLTGA